MAARSFCDSIVAATPQSCYIDAGQTNRNVSSAVAASAVTFGLEFLVGKAESTLILDSHGETMQ